MRKERSKVMVVAPDGAIWSERMQRGRERLAAEAARVAAVKAGGAAPEGVGPAVVDVAPGRGPVAAFSPVEFVTRADGSVREQPAGHFGRSALRRCDVWDRMTERALARKGGVAPFTAAQIAAGRAYAGVAERLAASGLRSCLSDGAGGGALGGYSEAVLEDIDRLRRMRARIGDGWALSPVEAAPARDRRRPLRVIELVDMVCLGEMALTAVLGREGWPRRQVYRVALRAALAGALDRLYGY